MLILKTLAMKICLNLTNLPTFVTLMTLAVHGGDFDDFVFNLPKYFFCSLYLTISRLELDPKE